MNTYQKQQYERMRALMKRAKELGILDEVEKCATQEAERQLKAAQQEMDRQQAEFDTFPVVDHFAVAYKSWKWEPAMNGGALYTTGSGRATFWHPGTRVEAQCKHSPIAPHSLNCSCGIYGATDQETANSYLSKGGIYGTVRMWGKLIEHASGFRSQYAYPNELWVEDTLLEKHFDRLKEYGVPLNIIIHRSERFWTPTEEDGWKSVNQSE